MLIALQCRLDRRRLAAKPCQSCSVPCNLEALSLAAPAVQARLPAVL